MEGGREGGIEGGREREKKGWRERGREGSTEGGREGETEGWREGGRAVCGLALDCVQRLSPIVRQIDFALNWTELEAGRALYK